MKNFLLKEIVVWLIIFVGLVIFFTFAYIIATNKSSFLTPFMIYKTHLAESAGIYVGSKVTIHGTNTGNILKTTFLPNGNIEIQFSVKKSHTFGVTESSVVQLKNSGALGDRFINILTSDLSAPKLKRGALIPYKEAPTLLSLLTESGGKTKKSIQDFVVQIDDLIKSIKNKGFSGLLSKNNKEDLTQILKSTKNILKKVETGQGTLGALIYDRSLYNRLLLLLGQRPKNNYLQYLSRRSQKSEQ